MVKHITAKGVPIALHVRELHAKVFVVALGGFFTASTPALLAALCGAQRVDDNFNLVHFTHTRLFGNHWSVNSPCTSPAFFHASPKQVPTTVVVWLAVAVKHLVQSGRNHNLSHPYIFDALLNVVAAH